MKKEIISYMEWERLVGDLTGLEYAPHVDEFYELRPADGTFPKWFLKRRPYSVGTADCDDRSKYGYCELHDKNNRVPVVLVRGWVKGFGYHEFLIVGCLDSEGNPQARYCHRLTDGFEWISEQSIIKVDSLW